MGDTKIEWTDAKGRQLGAKNFNWKGGRTVASNGYVLIKLPGHHLADVRGYVYEHRLVAEQKLGRRLLPGEIPHHIDGNKQNNDPANIEVLEGIAQHLYRHRKTGSSLRLPGENNSIVKCACGCNGEFDKFDRYGRPRLYISGHNPSPSPTVDAILSALKSGPLHPSEIVRSIGGTRHSVATALSKLKKRGLVTRLGGGFWGRGSL